MFHFLQLQDTSTEALSRHDTIDYVFCFENRGEEIGVTLSHPHGQIYGYPFVPPRFYRAAEAARRFRERTGDCLQCRLLTAELDAGVRIVTESDGWVAYVPFAARWPYEVRVVPREHVPDLPALSDELRQDLATVYRDALRRFDAVSPLARPVAEPDARPGDAPQGPTEAQVRASLPVDYLKLQDTWAAWKPSGDGSLPK